jgi:hypothetical protein
VDEHVRQAFRFGEVAARAKYARGERPNVLVHVILGPAYKFLKRYVFQRGFLDGWHGFVYCAVAASINFFKYLRLAEYRRNGLPEETPRNALPPRTSSPSVRAPTRRDSRHETV